MNHVQLRYLLPLAVSLFVAAGLVVVALWLAPRHWRRRAGDGERGDGGGNALAWLLVMPAVFMLVFGGIQFGMVSYANGLALAAAQAGVRAGSTPAGNAPAAAAAAQQFLDKNAAGNLYGPSIPVSVGGGTVTVTVTAHCKSIVPWLAPTVTQTASGPVEVGP